MRIPLLLYTVSLLDLCYCREPNGLRREVVDVSFDISSPNPSLARDYESAVDGVVHHSFFSTGLFFSKVVDGGVTLWEAEGEERCDVLFSNVGDRTRVILHVWVKGLPSRMMHYEKLDGEWKLVTIRVKGVPESEEPVSPKEHAELNFANLGCPLGGSSGSEAKPKVTLPPTESNNNGEDASENKVEGGTPDDEEESGESQPKEVDKEEPDQQSNEYAAGPVADPQESGDIPPESPANDSSCQPQTEDTEQTTVSSSDPVDQQPIESTGSHLHPDEESDVTPSEPATETLDLSHHNDSQIDLKKGNVSGLDYNIYSPKKDVKITSVVDSGDNAIWTASEEDKFLSAKVSSNGESSLAMISLKKAANKSFDHPSLEKYKSKLEDLESEVTNQPSLESSQESHNPTHSETSLASTVESPTEGSSETPQSTGKVGIPPPSDPKTLDLACLKDSRYKMVDVNIDGVPAKLYAINHSANINTVMNGKYTLRKGWSGDKCQCCITLLKGNEISMIVVFIGTSRHLFSNYYEYSESAKTWIPVMGECAKKFNALKVSSDPAKFTLDLSSLEEDDKFKLVKEDRDGIATLFYSSKPGHAIEKVVSGSETIWTPTDDKGTRKILMLHVKKDAETFVFPCFENTDASIGFAVAHSFTNNGYAHSTVNLHNYTDEDDDNKKGDKRGSYEGGLVFEPISGLYDNFVLLLDFNSLYPSIIQEFNICFTTAVIEEEGEGEPKVEILNDVTGMLPQILRRLVDLRFSVKSVLASEKNEARRIQLGVRQLALKLAANSLYGCLGSVYSRFHAKHLAAYITHQGRTVLRSTKEKVENSFNLQVIYGDTDSLMINTNIKDDGQLVNFEAANNLAKTIISTVNKGHKKLEIGIDAIFNRLLLLKKKKYAALKVNDYSEQNFSREIKGLDFIRRDWSLLTKEVGNVLLSIILNANYGSGVDGIVEQIHETLRDVNQRIKDGQIPTKSWLITRQLTKNPKEYADVHNLPHVSVALRLNEKGLTNYSAGHEVSFIICSKESIAEIVKGDTKSLSSRAFALSEVEELGLSPDISYYKTQQLFPPILRLCGLIEGTDAQRLAKCLELESSASLNVIASGTNSFEFAEQESRALALIKRTEEHYKEVELMTRLVCQVCNGFVFPSFFLKYLKCNHCKSWMPIHLLKNWIDRALYEVALQACFCIRICNICNTTTLNVCLGAQDVCPQPTCQSSDSMEVVLTSSKIYLYYDYLVFMLEGSLKDPEEDEDVVNSLVNVTVDYDGKMTVLYNSEPFKEVKRFDNVLKEVVEQNTLKATSGLRVYAQHILGIIESLPFLQYYTLDYAKERELLCQKVKILQQKHAYSVINLCDIFGVFNIRKTAVH
ncbi:DNA polymerase family B member protein [Theileria equi strain WA]|uniref:DNA polymerase n=1 Tax=Theileria equi strain WA TaxID=1537102 RepID=L1LAS9_THEEQ|nr:DNA polymerase family B member protein [Theileria equi strain WA]EKX72572.1 DNA polymerase family B member protein [Theileria equi strain WA]|eukprot:XP_004832024.1 DNA polymerase family B member protein [Theileria equi strain WA]